MEIPARLAENVISHDNGRILSDSQISLEELSVELDTRSLYIIRDY